MRAFTWLLLIGMFCGPGHSAFVQASDDPAAVAQALKWLNRVSQNTVAEFGMPGMACIEQAGKLPPRELQQLQHIGLFEIEIHGVTDEHIPHLSNIPQLRILIVRSQVMTGRTLNALHAPTLFSLSLRDCPITDGSLGLLNLPELASLDLSGSLVTNRTLRDVPPTVVSLGVSNTLINGQGVLSALQTMPLTHLKVSLDQCSDDVMACLASHQSLKVLSIDVSTAAEQKLAATLANALPNIHVRTRMVGKPKKIPGA